MVYAQDRLSAGALIDVGKISRRFPLVPLAIDAKLTEGDNICLLHHTYLGLHM